jgi:hypothetical protein
VPDAFDETQAGIELEKFKSMQKARYSGKTSSDSLITTNQQQTAHGYSYN